MSEVDNHYGFEQEPARPSPARPARREPARPELLDSISTRVSAAVDGLRDGADETRAWSQERYRDSAAWVSDSVETVSRNARYARRRSFAQINRGSRTVQDFVDHNPIMLGVVGLAAGLLLGALLPGTRRENEVLGPLSDDVRDQGLRYAKGVAEDGRHFVEDNLERMARPRSRTEGRTPPDA